MSNIVLRGLRAGNLRDLDLELPHGRWTAVHGPSGAGKSALLFRTLEPVARQRFHLLEDPQALPGQEEQWLPHVATSMEGLQPVLAAAGEIPRGRRAVEVGAALDLWAGLIRVFDQHASRRCPECAAIWKPLQADQLSRKAAEAKDGTVVHLFAAADGQKVGDLLQAGWTRAKLADEIDGPLTRLEEAPDPLPKTSWLLLDRLKWKSTHQQRFDEAADEAVRRGGAVRMEVGGFGEVFPAPGQCPLCQHKVPARDHSSLRIDREIDDLVVENRSWKDWCHAPLGEWLELPGNPGFRVKRRLEYLDRTRLGHLSATRTLGTLSLGEGRRMELVALLSQIRRGQLALFDEPGMGLHGSERRALASLLRELVEQGNTVLTADPAREFLEAADHWLLLGPGGGAAGGTVVGQGSREQLPKTETLIKPPIRNTSSSSLVFKKLQHRFLNIPKLELPLGQVVSVVGVSGSGKSTLLEAELVPRLREERDFSGKLPAGGVAVLLERALGSSAFSTLATLSGAWKEIRDAFAAGEEARIRGISAADLVARMGKGACPSCRGHGLHVDRLPCSDCGSLGLRDDLLQLRLRNRSLRKWLTTPLMQLEKRLPSDGKLRTLVRHLTTLGLGNRTFGERGVHLSLGERGRIALAKALASSRRDRPKLFLLDEPCLGLPFQEAHHVVQLLHDLCQQGHSFWVVEHHEVMLRSADHVVEIGPGAGPQGGQLLFQGAPEKLSSSKTPTGIWMASRASPASLPKVPEDPAPLESEALSDDWSRLGRSALEQDLLRELSTRSPLLADMPGLGEDLIEEATALPPTAWPDLARSDSSVWGILGLETLIHRTVLEHGTLGCTSCGGSGPWKDLYSALEQLEHDTGLLSFSSPVRLPKGSKGGELALLQAAGFRKVLRQGEVIRPSPKTGLQPDDAVWLDAFDPSNELRTGRVQDLEHHAALLGGGELLVSRAQGSPWKYQIGACRDCGQKDIGVSHQLKGRSLLALQKMPLQDALLHLAAHGQSPVFSKALDLLSGSELMHHVGVDRARSLTMAEHRACRIAGWLLFPLEGVVLLHDQPLSGLPSTWAKKIGQQMLDGSSGCHRFTDPEGHTCNHPEKRIEGFQWDPMPLGFDPDPWANPPLAPMDSNLRRALGLQAALRQHFLRTEEARLRGLTDGDLRRARGGRICHSCNGQGSTRLHPQLRIDCVDCKGSGWGLDLQALEDRGLRWTELGRMTLAQVKEHFSATPGIENVLALALQAGLGEVPLDAPLTQLPLGCRALAPILAALAAGAPIEKMRLASPGTGLNYLDVKQLSFTIAVFASTQLTPIWRDQHPALAPFQ